MPRPAVGSHEDSNKKKKADDNCSFTDFDVDYDHAEESPPPKEGNRLDFDGASLHTNDTDVESWYSGEESSGCYDVATRELNSSCQACDKPDDGSMIKCDRSGHDENEGWYHYGCAGVSESKLPEEWFCPRCRPRYQFFDVSGRPTVGGKGIALPAHLAVQLMERASDKKTQVDDSSRRRVAAASDGFQSSKNRQQSSLSTVSVIVEVPLHMEAVRRPQAAPKKRAARKPKATRKRKAAAKRKAAPKKTSTTTATEKKKWDNDTEKRAVGALMAEMLTNVEGDWVRTERKWEVLSTRLGERYQFDRKPLCVKNFWSRQGRRMFGLDERKKPKAHKMVTSVQDPLDRKRRREEKKQQQAQQQDTSTASYAKPNHDKLTTGTVSNRPTKPTHKRKREEDGCGDDEPVIHHRRRQL